MKRAVMRRIAIVSALVFAGSALFAAGPLRAQETDSAAPSSADTSPKRPVHRPARITVRPLVRSYPGPEAVRQCTFWLATENRPSGTVIVPRQHCWWERG